MVFIKCGFIGVVGGSLIGVMGTYLYLSLHPFMVVFFFFYACVV